MTADLQPLLGIKASASHATSQTNMGSFVFHAQHFVFLPAKQARTVFTRNFPHSHAGSLSSSLLGALVRKQVTNTSKSFGAFLQVSWRALKTSPPVNLPSGGKRAVRGRGSCAQPAGASSRIHSFCPGSLGSRQARTE